MREGWGWESIGIMGCMGEGQERTKGKADENAGWRAGRVDCRGEVWGGIGFHQRYIPLSP